MRLIPTEDLAPLKELIEAGKVTPVIDRTYPLSETPAALRYLDTRTHTGQSGHHGGGIGGAHHAGYKNHPVGLWVALMLIYLLGDVLRIFSGDVARMGGTHAVYAGHVAGHRRLDADPDSDGCRCPWCCRSP